MTGTKKWTIETAQYAWLLENRGLSHEEIAQQIYDRFPRFCAAMARNGSPINAGSIKYATGKDLKKDPQ